MPAASIRSIRGATRCWASAPGRRSPHCRRFPSTPISSPRPRRRWRRSRSAPGSACRSSPRSPTASARPARKERRARRGSGSFCKDSGTRLVGPSSLGVVDLRHKTFLTANAAFDEPDLPVGRIFAASHSGGMIGTFLSRGKARGIHLRGARFGRQRGRSFDRRDLRGDARRSRHRRLRAVPRNHAQGRGVARLRARSGQTRQAGAGLQARPLGRGARVGGVAHRRARGRGRHRRHVPRRMRHRARRHAGGPDRGIPAAGARAGRRARRTAASCRCGDDHRRRRDHGGRSAERARHRGRAADAADAGAHQGRDRRRGHAGAADRSHTRRRAVQGDEGRARRADHRAGIRSGRGRVGSSARFYPDLAVKPIIDSAGAKKPIAAFLVPEAPDALARLAAAGVPNFHTPEACADAVAAALHRHAPRPIEVQLVQRIRRGPMLDELEAYALLDRSACRMRHRSRSMPTSSRRPALPFAYPVVVKALSAAIAHKSDVGGVVLNVAMTQACWPPSRRSRRQPRWIACWCSR